MMQQPASTKKTHSSQPANQHLPDCTNSATPDAKVPRLVTTPVTVTSCTQTAIRALTQPLVETPAVQELAAILQAPWQICIPVSPTDYTMRHHWRMQRQAQQQSTTPLLESMFDWEPPHDMPVVATNVALYFGLGEAPNSPFFDPIQDVSKALQQLLHHQVASRQAHGGIANGGGHTVVLSHLNVPLFVATAAGGSQIDDLRHVVEDPARLHPKYYLLRCHYDKAAKQLVFGYHRHQQQGHGDDTNSFATFHSLVRISLQDQDWRCTTCVVLKNLARILNCLKDYTVPLMWQQSPKLSLQQHMQHDGRSLPVVQKVYRGDLICPQLRFTVQNMIEMYRQLEHAAVPHTDRLVSVVVTTNDNNNHNSGDNNATTTTTICQFAPVGRAYLPRDLHELLDALVCVAESLSALHDLGLMHRDVRWPNVMHVLNDDTGANHFTREWILFDWEFAAVAPQPALGAHTLTPTNHAPEMVIVQNDNQHHDATSNDDIVVPPPNHDMAVDVWGLGYLLQQVALDIPVSHAADLQKLQADCLQRNPAQRPTARQCLEQLLQLQARPASTELDWIWQST